MSQSKWVKAFIDIIKFYGFDIKADIVNDIITKGKIIDNVKKIKPIIGLHFHEKCCLKDGQLATYCTPQYKFNKYGWIHGCAAYHSKSIYLSNEFRNNACDQGELNSSEHNCMRYLH